jgi:2-dehydro-3-deoxyphosphogluconate aldolase/(4S)-4-hydroxy-2-oxoglutarate aldolase
MKTPTTLNLIQRTLTEQKLLPLFYHDDVSACENAIQACYEAGCRIFEFTNRGSHALANFTRLREKAAVRWPGMLLGVGTIQSVRHASDFQSTGADFLISPFMDRSIGEYCQEHTISYLPGCMTPSEIHVARQVGCSIVKIFPASVVTRDFMKAVKDIFPGMKYIVTGGITATQESMEHWVDQDVLAIGLGSQLFKKEWIKNGQWSAIRDQLKSLFPADRAD